MSKTYLVKTVDNIPADEFGNVSLGVGSPLWSAGTGPNSVTTVDTDNTASGYYSVAIGRENTTNGTNSFASGNQNQVTGINSQALGDRNVVNGDASHAQGGRNTISGSHSFVGGYVNISEGDYSFTHGSNNRNRTNFGVIDGGTNNEIFTTGQYSAIGGGTTNEIGSQYSFAFGNVVNLLGPSSTGQLGIGAAIYSYGNYTTALGYNLSINNSFGIAMGNIIDVNADYGVGIGYQNKVNGSNSFVLGSGSTANGSNTFILGQNITGSSDNTTYVEHLNIKSIPTGTSVTNIGIDINGNVVVLTLNTYTNEAAAIADGSLASGQWYKNSTDHSIHYKP